jgi:hypothetical protein
MPDTQQTQPGFARLSLSTFDDSSYCLDDSDDALGCESAYPSLQIERWAEVPPPELS